MTALVDATVPLRARLARVSDHACSAELGGVLTAVFLLAFSEPEVRVQTPLGALAIAGICFRQLLSSWRYWAVVTGILATSALLRWATLDNHQWLAVYWCAVLAATAASGRGEADRRAAARALVGIAFGWATLHKLGSSQFMSGDFFAFQFATDERFASVAKLFGRSTALELELLRNEARSLTNPLATLDAVPFAVPPGLLPVARVGAVAVVAMEGILAAAFLVPRATLLARIRNPALVVFIFTTYPIAPVIGFGWLLALMGLTQCREGEKVGRALYLACLVALPLMTVNLGALYLD